MAALNTSTQNPVTIVFVVVFWLQIGDMKLNSRMPKPREAEPAMSKARVKGERTTLIGNSKMSITCCPYLFEKDLYWVSANCFKLFISFSVEAKK